MTLNLPIVMLPSREEQEARWGANHTVRFHDGYSGFFTRDQAAGALPSGAHVMKITYRRGDAVPLWTKGVVLGSVMDSLLGLLYFVEWAGAPGVALGILAKNVQVEECS